MTHVQDSRFCISAVFPTNVIRQCKCRCYQQLAIIQNQNADDRLHFEGWLVPLPTFHHSTILQNRHATKSLPTVGLVYLPLPNLTHAYAYFRGINPFTLSKHFDAWRHLLSYSLHEENGLKTVRKLRDLSGNTEILLRQLSISCSFGASKQIQKNGS